MQLEATIEAARPGHAGKGFAAAKELSRGAQTLNRELVEFLHQIRAA
jgi:hypothetical protein